MKQLQNPIVLGVVVVLIAGVAFFGGVQYGKSTTTSTTRLAQGQGRFTQGMGANGATGSRRGSFGGNGAMTIGEVLTKDDKSITVKLPAGGSKIVFFSNTTPVQKTVPGANTDIEVGTSVAVSGTTNADGSVTAQDIQIRPTPQGGRASSTPQQ